MRGSALGGGRGQAEPRALEQLAGDGVALRVDGGGVERLVAVADAQEAGGLLEGLGAEAGHLLERGAVGEGAVLVAVRHDLLGQLGADAGDIGEQGGRGGVDVHADLVDDAFDHAVEAAGQLLLVDVVLVQADADRLGVDLDQLGQRVLDAAGDGDGAAHADVEVGHLGAGQRAGASRRWRRPR